MQLGVAVMGWWRAGGEYKFLNFNFPSQNIYFRIICPTNRETLSDGCMKRRLDLMNRVDASGGYHLDSHLVV
jgi:hypothetical protein